MFRTLALLFAVCFAIAPAYGGSVVVNPSSIDNSYVGKITVTVSGLPPGATIILKHILDLNGNGAADATDPVILAGPITDGVVYGVAGVRNTNIPGDDDLAANGTITCGFRYPSLEATICRIACQHLVVVSDPSGQLPSVTTPFTVSQHNYPCTINGTVSVSGGGAVVGCPVALVDIDGSGLSGAVTGPGGAFTIKAPEGMYMVVPLVPGYVSDFQQGFVYASPGSPAVADLTVVPASRTITGRLYDAATMTGIPGVFINCDSEEDRFAGTFTVADGSFVLAVTPGVWSVYVSDDVGHAGFVMANDEMMPQANTTSGNVSGYAIPLTRMEALAYGIVRDDSGAVRPEFRISASLHPLYSSTGRSDSTGRYSAALTRGEWWIGMDADSYQTRNWIGTQANLDVLPGQAYLVDVFIHPRGADITGSIMNTDGDPLAGISTYGRCEHNGRQYHSYFETDDEGNFALPSFPGTWYVGMDCDQVMALGYACPSEHQVTSGAAGGSTSFTLLRQADAVPIVTDEGAFTTSRTQLSASWTFDTGPIPYDFQAAVGTTPEDPGAGYVSGWQFVSGGYMTRTGLELSRGQTYYVYVKARPVGGSDWTGSGASDGILCVGGTTSVGFSKFSGSGQPVAYDEVIAAATSAETGGYIQVLAKDRSSGIAVQSQAEVQRGDILQVAGLMAKNSNEECYLASGQVKVLRHEPEPKPLDTDARSLQGSTFWTPIAGGHQRGVDGGQHLNTVGQLVRVTGRIGDGDSGYATLDDSSLPSGQTLLVDPQYQPAGYGPGQLVQITGIVGLAKVGGSWKAVLRPRSADDFSNLLPEM